MSKKTEHTKQIWTKMSGAGNRFWISDFTLSDPSPQQDWPEMARAFCQKNSADGLVVLLPATSFDFEWLFYNADGSTAEMCGNAACCVTHYIFTKKLIPPGQNSFTLKTESGPVQGEWIEGRARMILKQSTNIKGPFPACFKPQSPRIWQTVKKSKQYNQENLTYMFINSSVPHAVIHLPVWPVAKKPWEEYTKLARSLRKNTTHHKKGMNVSFYCEQDKSGIASYLQKKSEDGNTKARLIARTFERGVEDFTPACGTGALAVAQVYRKLFTNLNSVLVKMPGGDLTVTFHSDKKISLMSPVKKLSERRV